MDNSRQSKNGVETKKQAEKIADWDEISALNRMGGEINDLLSVIKLYIIDMPSQLEKLQQAFECNDFAAAQRAAHTIKGVAANLSALKLQNLVADLEGDIKFLLREPSPGGKKPLILKTSELIQTNNQVTQLLTQYLSEHTLEHEASQEQLTHKQLKTMLEPLVVKIQQGGYIESQELEKLRVGTYDEGLRQVMNQLLQQISQFDSNSALQSIHDIMLKIESAPADEEQNG